MRRTKHYPAFPKLFLCQPPQLARLLLGIEGNKEFTEFFNDPKRERLSGWQSFIFSAMGIVGFVLGAILGIAAAKSRAYWYDARRSTFSSPFGDDEIGD